jgi:hypothetical protein
MRTSISLMMPWQELADDQLEPAKRRDVQLLERADFALAHDGHRGGSTSRREGAGRRCPEA